MIRTEFHSTRPDGVKLFRTYSDEGYQILQADTGAAYSEAIDVENSGHTYEETDILVEDDLTDSQALRILLGGEAGEPD